MSYEYTLSTDEIKQIKKFSESINTNHYSGRGQFSPQKRREDQEIGKSGEIVAYHVIQNILPNISKPDFEIYSVGRKSWDFDMKTDEYNIHIKTQSLKSAKLYGSSFIFEKTDKKIFKDYSDNDYVSFVQFDYDKKSGKVLSFMPVKMLHYLSLFKDPVNKNLITKQAVYYKDLEKFDLYDRYGILADDIVL